MVKAVVKSVVVGNIHHDELAENIVTQQVTITSVSYRKLWRCIEIPSLSIVRVRSSHCGSSFIRFRKLWLSWPYINLNCCIKFIQKEIT